MNENKIQDGINKLASLGLNLFSCVKVDLLPKDILTLFDLQKISYDKNDTLCVLAHGGKTLWKNLPHPLIEENHPIDRFSIEQMKLFAKNYLEDDIQILFPHSEYTIPLQRLGRFMNLSRSSLLGLDINKEYGVWFAFRGAFLTSVKIPEQKMKDFSSPCESCPDQPCINACPATAVLKNAQFNISQCATYRLSDNSKCKNSCLSRLSCPYKSEHQYESEQIHYHMSRTQHLLKLSSFIK